MLGRLLLSAHSLVHRLKNLALCDGQMLALHHDRFAYAAAAQAEAPEAVGQHALVAFVFGGKRPKGLAGRVLRVQSAQLSIGEPSWRSLMVKLSGAIVPQGITRVRQEWRTTVAFDLTTHGGYYAAAVSRKSSGGVIVSNCRCWVTEHTQQSLKRYGLDETGRPDIPDVEYEHPKTGEKLTVPEGVRPGFGQRNWDSAIRDVYEQRLAAAAPEVRRAIKSGTPEDMLQERRGRKLASPGKWKHGPTTGELGEVDEPWPNDDSPTRRAIARSEAKIARESNEHASGWKANGTLLFDAITDGEPNRVTIPKKYERHLVDGVVTHGHPSGRSLSADDVGEAIALGVAEIRVTGIGPDRRRYAYALRRPSEGWPSEMQVQNAYLHAIEEADAFLQTQVDAGIITPSDATYLRRHEIWKRVARQLGMDYRRFRP